MKAFSIIMKLGRIATVAIEVSGVGGANIRNGVRNEM